MKKYMGNKKEVLLFYLLMIAVIGWFVVAETVYPSERIKVSRRRILHTGGHLPGKKWRNQSGDYRSGKISGGSGWDHGAGHAASGWLHADIICDPIFPAGRKVLCGWRVAERISYRQDEAERQKFCQPLCVLSDFWKGCGEDAADRTDNTYG